jgi:broad specificity phosphatase PhoE
MQLVLVRHAQSIWNAEDRWQGQTDVPLSELGRDEARRIGARLGPERFDRIVASDLSRAMDTARAIAGERAVEPRAGLREMNLGAWCGLPHEDVMARFPEELLALQRGEPMRIGGTGETLHEFGARVLAELAALEQGDGERVLVVAHGGVVRAVLFALLGLVGRHRPLVGAGNTSVTVLETERGARRLRVYNDQRHLDLFSEERDEVLPGASGRAGVIEALALDPTAPLAELDDAARAVIHRTSKGAVQLRRYGVRSAE